MRQAFYDTTAALLGEDPRTALVLADISAAALADSLVSHPDRAINVGIREQLLVSVAGGLALTGLRPIVHTYAPFLVERAWEQIKLDLDHQGTGAILVSVGASHDEPSYGRTHSAPGDVALLDTLRGWTVHVPGHPDEVGPLLRAAVTHDDPVYVRLALQRNAIAYPDAWGLLTLRPGRRAVVIAVGPMLDRVLAATEGLDVTVLYTHTPRPLDAAGLRSIMDDHDTVILVEPYLAGTSTTMVSRALADRPVRIIGLGVGGNPDRRIDLHRYGTIEQHDAAHGLDVSGLRSSITNALATPSPR